MKLIQLIPAIVLLLAAGNCVAQEKEDGKEKKKTAIVIGTDAIKITHTDEDGKEEKEDKDDKKFKIGILMFDFGLNNIDDKTDYSSKEAQDFLNVDPTLENENLFSLKNNKSVNVDIYPIIGRFRVLNTNGQKIYIGMGVGLQLYNFRFTKNISYTNVTTPQVNMDTLLFTKNKLAFNYLSVPLMATFKTKLAEKAWLVYGVGITGGYRISSWTKQVSGELGKVKNHDQFNFKDFNSCVTAEIGLDDYFRLYASYQITPMHEYALDQHPYCIGLRFGGM